MKNVLEKLVRPSDRMRACAVLAVRLALGWKLAYLGSPIRRRWAPWTPSSPGGSSFRVRF